MKQETLEERFIRLSALAAQNGTSWDAEAAKEVSALAKGFDWRKAARTQSVVQPP